MTAETNELLLENKDYPADVTCHVRDPKVWAQDGRYYMVLGARTKDDRGELLVYESADKRNWTHMQHDDDAGDVRLYVGMPRPVCVDGQWFRRLSPQGYQPGRLSLPEYVLVRILPAVRRLPR